MGKLKKLGAIVGVTLAIGAAGVGGYYACKHEDKIKDVIQDILPGDEATALADYTVCGNYIIGYTGTSTVLENMPTSYSMKVNEDKVVDTFTLEGEITAAVQAKLLKGAFKATDAEGNTELYMNLYEFMENYNAEGTYTFELLETKFVEGEDYKITAINSSFATLEMSPSLSLVTKIVIPEGITDITGAFSGLSALEEVILPESLTSIGASAFEGCTSLASITYSSVLTNIGNSAFSNCTSLTNITIPSTINSISKIENSAFEGCTNLTTVTIDSKTIYTKLTSISAVEGLIEYATTINVLSSLVNTNTNEYLNDSANYTKSETTTDINGQAYYTFTKVQ